MSDFSDLIPASHSRGRFSSESITFRLQKAQLDQLREEAIEKRISLNTLVSQMVDSYVNFNSHISKAGLIPVSKHEIISLLEGYDEEEIKVKAKQNLKKIAKDVSFQLKGKYDFDALIDIFNSWLTATGFSYRHDKNLENESSTRHTFVVQHNMGRKYSVYLAEGAKTYLEPLSTKAVECSITDNCVVITVDG